MKQELVLSFLLIAAALPVRRSNGFVVVEGPIIKSTARTTGHNILIRLATTTSSSGSSILPTTTDNKRRNNNNNNLQETISVNDLHKNHHHHLHTPQQVFSPKARQLLGVKDAAYDAFDHEEVSQMSEESNKIPLWKLRIQLMKPITWIPLSLCVVCGAISSGNIDWTQTQDWIILVATILLAGPCSEGFAQTINDWYDRDIDAINEPHRPIPSGAISPQQVYQQLYFLLASGLTIAMILDFYHQHLMTAATDPLTVVKRDTAIMSSFPIVTALTSFGFICSYIYSAPPLKLKQNGWTGDIAIGLCYISLPWFCGRAVFGTLEQPMDWIL